MSLNVNPLYKARTTLPLRMLLIFCSVIALPLQAASPPPGQSGFKMVSIDKGSIFEKLGLKEGDIIKNYNGKEIKTPEDAKAVFEDLKTAKKVKLTVERNGKTQIFHYNVN
jgi:type II secretory pathway component PulC